MVATILLNSLSWLAPAVVLSLLACGVLAWSYRQSRLRGVWRGLCLILKALSILGLAVCLLEPLWITQRARTGANYFLILADNSLSLQIHDRGSPTSRGEELKKSLNEKGVAWQAQLAKDFQVRRYLFDSRLQRVESFSEMAFDGRSSALNSALKSVRERFANQPLAGILLFTDGNATDLPRTGIDTNQLPPIYPVVVGEDFPARDVSIQGVTASQTAFEDSPVTAQVEVMAYGCSSEKITAQLLDVSGKQVAELSETANSAESRLNFRFQFKPDKAGLSYYTVRVAAAVDLIQFTDPKQNREATLANNSRMFVVDRGQEPFRILYVSGRPNWEYKFLNRALQEDSQLQMVALIRVARREPKFAFKGRTGETSNPLFRGFANPNKEEVEHYDQPVLVRLNTRDQAELQAGFPKTAEDLFSYHAIVLDDVEADFFTPDQMQLIQKFVSQRGGGLLMLGGKESFAQGKYNRTPIGDLLPVYLDSPMTGPPATNNLRLTLTREGFLQPWIRLRAQETDEKLRLDGMPGFQVLNKVRDFKPGATVVATVHDDRDTTYPAVAVQRYGNGRSAAILVGDIWRWGLRSAEMRKDMERAWRQIVRWLVSDVPTRVELQAEPLAGDPNQAVTLQVRAHDPSFQPVDNAKAMVTLVPIGTSGSRAAPIQLEAEASSQEPGLYEATYIPRDSGAYEARAVVTGADGKEEGKIGAGFVSDSGSDEFQALKPNRSLLETLAKSTGGELVLQNKLLAFVKDLPNRKVPLMETAASPLWHRSWVFLFALLCFITEWGIRRWKGLA